MTDQATSPEEREKNLTGVLVSTDFGLEPFDAEFDDNGRLLDSSQFTPGTTFVSVTEEEMGSWQSAWKGEADTIKIINGEDGAFEVVFEGLGGYAVASQVASQQNQQ